MSYYLNNNCKYDLKFERDKIKVTESKPMFDGAFYSETEMIFLDNMCEVRDYLKEKNGGVDVW